MQDEQEEEARAVIRQVESALASRPDHASHWVCRARMWTELGDATRALSTLEEGARRFPESPKIRIALADASRLAGKHDRALELYEALTDAPRELHAEDLAGVWSGGG